VNATAEIKVLLAGACAVQLLYEEIGDASDEYGSDDDEKALQPLLLELSANEEISVVRGESCDRDGGLGAFAKAPRAQNRDMSTTSDRV
jgi:hypothetical protein